MNSTGADVVTPPASGGALPRPDALFTPTDEGGRQNGPPFVSFVSTVSVSLDVVHLMSPSGPHGSGAVPGKVRSSSERFGQDKIEAERRALFFRRDHEERPHHYRYHTRTGELRVMVRVASTGLLRILGKFSFDQWTIEGSKHIYARCYFSCHFIWRRWAHCLQFVQSEPRA